MKILLIEPAKRLGIALQKALIDQSVAADLEVLDSRVISLVQKREYDVILFLMTPGNSLRDLAFCQQLRFKGISIPLIIIAPSGRLTDIVKGLDSGADDYLVKPFNLAELFARIRALSRRKENFQKQQQQIGDLVIHPERRIVRRAHKVVELSPKEFRLLEFLVGNYGKPLSRYEIMENVWGTGEHMFSNIVDVHMSHLRSKIDKGYLNPLIHTIRGGGYVFEAVK